MGVLPTGVDQSLIRKLSEKYPQKSGLGIDRVEMIQDGWETDLYVVRCKYQLKNQQRVYEYVLRLYDPSAAALAKKDFSVLQWVRGKGILVPGVELLIAASQGHLETILVMERVPGLPLSSILQDASENEKTRFVSRMAEELYRIHAITGQTLPFFDEEEKIQKSYIESLIGQIQKTSEEFGLPEFEPLVAWLRQNTPAAEPDAKTFLHNDFHAQNIMVREPDDRFVILDWSFCNFGDYRMDLAWTSLLVGVNVGKAHRDTFIGAYETASRRPVHDLEFYEALKFSLRMATIGSWLDERVEIPVKKITKQALRGSYRVHVHNVYRRLKEITGIVLPTLEDL
jgi:aminoglycoside phosphotransferase (APT) family kinase protein